MKSCATSHRLKWGPFPLNKVGTRDVILVEISELWQYKCTYLQTRNWKNRNSAIFLSCCSYFPFCLNETIILCNQFTCSSCVNIGFVSFKFLCVWLLSIFPHPEQLQGRFNINIPFFCQLDKSMFSYFSLILSVVLKVNFKTKWEVVI